MERFRGYLVRSERVTVAGRVYDVLAPADCDRLLDDPRVVGRFERDEYLPYWAVLWPSALFLADAVAEWEPVTPDTARPQVLELGSGLGLAGLVALGCGYDVILSDYDDDALAFAEENVRRNELPVPAVGVIDWRATYADLHPDRIIAADVLYEARNLAPVAAFIARHLRPGGFALVSDPNRTTAEAFEHVARAAGLAVAVTGVERPGGNPGGRGRLFHLRHAASV